MSEQVAAVEELPVAEVPEPSLLTSLKTPARFSLKLAKLTPGVQYLGLNFNGYMRGDEFAFGDPLTHFVCGESMDYGALFAYLFRRFGYQNTSSDNYKSLTEYLLKTPSKDLVLGVRPYVGSSSQLHFQFYVPRTKMDELDAYERREKTVWQQEAIAAAEARGLPDWMPAWLEFVGVTARGGSAAIPQSEWSETIWMMDTDYVPEDVPADDPNRALMVQAEAFAEDLWVQQRAVRPEPRYYHRHLTHGVWHDDDPLKPIAEAALAALKDLSRPVGVRDSYINAYGRVEQGDPLLRRTANRAAVAGYASGMLANEAPQEFGQLIGRIVQLGKGNYKKGILKALELLPEPKAGKSKAHSEE